MDTVSKKKRSEIMSRIRSKNTQPELTIRRYLHGLGFRYKLHDRRLPGCPDIVLRKYKTAIQVRGCFWHGHNCRSYPKSNREYWVKKINDNRKRDLSNDRMLRKLGYYLLILRECEVNKEKYKSKLKFFFESHKINSAF